MIILGLSSWEQTNSLLLHTLNMAESSHSETHNSWGLPAHDNPVKISIREGGKGSWIFTPSWSAGGCWQLLQEGETVFSSIVETGGLSVLQRDDLTPTILAALIGLSWLWRRGKEMKLGNLVFIWEQLEGRTGKMNRIETYCIHIWNSQGINKRFIS